MLIELKSGRHIVHDVLEEERAAIEDQDLQELAREYPELTPIWEEIQWHREQAEWE